MSSLVSVGSPTMKYNLMLNQPFLNISAKVSKISGSVSCLFITRRIRSLPASGAKVKPIFLRGDNASINSSEKLLMCRLGKDNDKFSKSWVKLPTN